MGELNTRIAIENLTANIAAEYYNLIRQRIRLRNLSSAVRLSKERLRIVEAHFVIGSMSGLELQQAKVYFNADSSLLLKQNETVNASLIKLNELMGLDKFVRDIQLFDTIPLNTSLVESELWQKTLDNNAPFLASQKNKTLSELDYKKLRSRNYPYVRVNAGYGYTANRYESGTTELSQRLGLNYGVTVGMTLFNGMNRQREQRNAQIQIQNSELRIQDFELALRADLANLWMAYLNNLELRELEQENLVVARENYEIAIERYRLGDLAGIDLREAQNSLLEAEERLSIAEYNTKLCEISLMQLSGQILAYLSE
jgi:outer membrane protein TolC